MLWIFLALVACCFWSLVNLGDKYILTKHISSVFVYTIMGFLAGILCLVILPFIDFTLPSLTVLFWLVMASLSFFVGTFFYVKSLSSDEVSRVAILFNLLPVFTLLFAWIFIAERLVFNQLLAFGILFVGAIFASLHFSKQKIKISKSLLWVILSCVFYASYDVLVRYITTDLGFPYVMVFVILSGCLAFFSLFLFISKSFRQEWKNSLQNKFSWKLGFLVVVIMAISRFGTLIHAKALSLGPASLVTVIEEGFQSIVVFVLAISLSFFAPKYIKEETDNKNLLLKLVALVLMIVGVVVLNLG